MMAALALTGTLALALESSQGVMTMDRVAVFVDAGYLFAAGSQLLFGETLSRTELQLDHPAVLELLADVARQLTGLPLLRVYWYDGAASGPTLQQLALAYQPNVKLRLGSISQHGHQKGVDALLVTDLITLARHRAMADAVLLTGDEDIRIGMQQAQELGVRAHLLGVEPARDNQSGLLVQEADELRELSHADLARCLQRLAPPTPSVVPRVTTSAGATPEHVLQSVAERLADQLDPELMSLMLTEAPGGSLPSEVDRRLLIAATQAVGGVPLTAEQKRSLRALFLDACQSSSRRSKRSR
jgi:uncharacterized LabA/DUF88 family protein